MYQHARDLEFEQAGRIRDEMQRLKAFPWPIRCRAGAGPAPGPEVVRNRSRGLQWPLSGD